MQKIIAFKVFLKLSKYLEYVRLDAELEYRMAVNLCKSLLLCASQP